MKLYINDICDLKRYSVMAWDKKAKETGKEEKNETEGKKCFFIVFASFCYTNSNIKHCNIGCSMCCAQRKDGKKICHRKMGKCEPRIFYTKDGNWIKIPYQILRVFHSFARFQIIIDFVFVLFCFFFSLFFGNVIEAMITGNHCKLKTKKWGKWR